jgi:hypothetical protein
MSYFIDSHYMEMWTAGASRGRGPPQFGSRVPHKIVRTSHANLTIGGFVECLEWYVSERLPEHMDI